MTARGTTPEGAAGPVDLKQVSRQCSAVRYLATSIALVYGDMARLFDAGLAEEIAGIQGQESAALMETLGDILNGMDAADDSDKWLSPIFHEAHRTWPTTGCSHCGGPLNYDDLILALRAAEEALQWHDGLEFEPTGRDGKTVHRIIQDALARAEAKP